MKSVLLIFHSNADYERVFSFVTKAETKLRASLSTETLLGDILIQYYMPSRGTECYEQKYSNSLLQQCKRATYRDLQEQKKIAEGEVAGTSS